MRTLAILPVKSFTRAKQRLSAGLSPALRESLAEAMLRDVLAALARSKLLDQVIVVSPSPVAQEIADNAGAEAIPDNGAGHNSAAEAGIEAALARGAERVLLVPGDCPALDPAEIDSLLSQPRPNRGVVVVPDRHGTGTNALLLTPPDALAPSFGPDSCARHIEHARQAGIAYEMLRLSSLGLDVDTPDDLEALADRGHRARHTLELLARC